MSVKVRCLFDKMVKVEDLIFNPKNRNSHPKEQVERLAKMITYQGWRWPIKVSNQSGYVSAGHGRALAAEFMGLKEVPVNYQDYDNEDMEMADLNGDNAIARWSDLDIEGIKLDIEELDDNFDLELLGIEDLSIIESEKCEPGCDEDSVPENVESRVKPGDLWVLGEHRLLCGDATNIQHVDRLMGGVKADMVFTSPPYNGNTHLDYGKGSNKKLYEHDLDNKDSGEYVDFCRSSLNILFSVCEGFIFWNVMYNANSRYEFLEIIQPYLKNLWESIVWKKQGMPISSGLTRNFEFIFCFKNGEKNHLGETFETEFNLWDISNKNSQDKENHRACFPVDLPKKAIEISTSTKEKVLDLFGGSGSTLIACEKTDRKCFMMEIDPHYCSVILSRWEKYTGKEAVLQSNEDPENNINPVE